MGYGFAGWLVALRVLILRTHTLHTLALGQIDYYFTDIDQMKRDIEADYFIEHAVVHKNLYGFC